MESYLFLYREVKHTPRVCSAAVAVFGLFTPSQRHSAAYTFTTGTTVVTADDTSASASITTTAIRRE